MYRPGSQHERCAAILGPMLNLRAVLEEEGHHSMVALPAGRGEGDVVVGATGSVDCCPCLQQQLCYLCVCVCVCVCVLCWGGGGGGGGEI